MCLPTRPWCNMKSLHGPPGTACMLQGGLLTFSPSGRIPLPLSATQRITRAWPPLSPDRPALMVRNSVAITGSTAPAVRSSAACQRLVARCSCNCRGAISATLCKAAVISRRQQHAYSFANALADVCERTAPTHYRYMARDRQQQTQEPCPDASRTLTGDHIYLLDATAIVAGNAHTTPAPQEQRVHLLASSLHTRMHTSCRCWYAAGLLATV